MWDAVTGDQRRAALSRILESQTFAKSERARELLAYVVEQDLAGNADAIKGFSIAVDVFGKDDSFDPVSDPLVRVQAGRLRDYLAEYYASEGLDDPVVIDIPRGGYRPVFSLRGAEATAITANMEKPADPDAMAPPTVEEEETAETLTAPAESDEHLPEAASSDASNMRPTEEQPARGAFSKGGLLAVLAGILALIGLALWYFSPGQTPQETGAATESFALPRLHVVARGDAPEIENSQIRVAAFLEKFDTITVRQPLEGATSPDYGPLDYVLEVSVLPDTGSNEEPMLKFDLVHAVSGRLLRSENYAQNIWVSPDLEVVAASKMSGLALPGGVVYANARANNNATAQMECLTLIERYYHLSQRENFQPAFDCTAQLQTSDTIGGLLKASHASLTARAIGRSYDIPGVDNISMDSVLDTALEGVDLAPTSARTAREVAYIHSWRGENGRMMDWLRRANELNPYDTSIAASYGYGLAISRRYEEAVAKLSTAVAATTRHPTWWDFYLALSYLMENDVERAKLAAEPLTTSPRNFFDAALNAALAFESGNTSLAATMVRRIEEIYPEFAEDPAAFLSHRPLPRDFLDRLIEDLEKAVGQ